MSLSEFKRIKHGQLPGDVGKGTKIKMRENPSKSKRAKTFNNMVKSTAKAKLKERARKEIKEETK